MWSAISLATAILGFFIALPMLVVWRRRPSTAWLGLFLLLMSALVLSEYLTMTDGYRRYPHLLGLLDWPIACIGAVYYCYVRSVVGLGNGRSQWRHAIPAGLFIIAIALFRIVTPVDDIAKRIPPFTGFTFDPLLLVFQLLAASYVVGTIHLVHQYRQRVRQNFSSIHRRNLTWLSYLSLLILLLLLLWIPMNIWRGMWEWLFGFGRIAMLYLIGWFGARHIAVQLPEFALPVADGGSSISPAPATTVAEGPGAALAPSGEKYARSGMTADDEALIGKRLQQRMQTQRDFTEPDLRLTELADRIGCSAQWLSQYLNEVEGQNFFDYINRWRVTEIQDLMRQSRHASTPLLDLAFAAGFNSKSTFYSSFKKHCGQSPSEWRKSSVAKREAASRVAPADPENK